MKRILLAAFGVVARKNTSPDAVVRMITGEALAGAGPAAPSAVKDGPAEQERTI
jgi:hypothetical protein